MGISIAEGVVLVLVDQGASHGWVIVQALRADGDIGRAWSLSRPLTYRAIDQLVDKDLLRRSGTSPGGGRDRVLLALTPDGRRAARAWLDEPVEHVRDVRTELLVKLLLRRRSGLDSAELIRAQRARLEPVLAALERPAGQDVVALWRAENVRAVRRFLDRVEARAPTSVRSHA